MSLSEMFGERILGGRTKIQVPEGINVQKPKLDLDVSSLKSESNIFDEFKIKEMINKKDKVFDFINDRPKGMKIQSLKEKAFTMDIKSKNLFSNKLPKRLNINKKSQSLLGGSKLPKRFNMDKLKINLYKVEKRALNNIVKRPDNIGFNRVINQGKLNMFGDADNDKLINILDCRPFDKKRQGAMDKVKHFFTGNKVETPVGELQTYQTIKPLPEITKSTEVEVLDSRMPLATGQQPITTFVKQNDSIFSQAMGKGKEFGLQAVQKTGAAGLVVAKAPFKAAKAVGEFGVGEVKDAWGRVLARREIRKEAYKEAAKTAGQLEAEKVYKEEMRKQLESLYPKTKDIHSEYSRNKLVYDPVVKSYIRTKPRVAKTAVTQLEALKQSVSPFALGQSIQSMIGIGRRGTGVYESVGNVGHSSFNSKVASLIKGDEVPPESVVGPSPTPVQPVQQYVPLQQVQQEPQQRGIYSPYSDRQVSYTRGPYKKRQYSQQQY